ncbi:WhiB family transcriptional regulator, redox-sensing transcriptional regulator [Prauserella marina]|uniref:WhiB family transcriptional regulator, redox-sensing transcriptional regulator n=1 Tax=Prauserella marina TaxID=530584 RepID=A0A1G6WAW9_9PSEU|nr:WhiB family redox-sensing transcriptional regulator [Prauserella marina]SDD62215.1 WhiB family transcriptional regulator, redox-sensing transcriptional regulator [Prauserella marina]
MSTAMPNSGPPEFDRDAYDERLFALTKFRHVPDDVLCDLVLRDGLCFWVFDRDEMPDLSGDEDADRALAAYLCAGCPVQDECLELELRVDGAETVGVWGAMTETDRRALYPAWRWHRLNPPEDSNGGERQ